MKEWCKRFGVALFYSTKHVFRAVLYGAGIGVAIYAVIVVLNSIADIAESGFAPFFEFAMSVICTVWFVLMVMLFGLLLVLVFKRDVEREMEEKGW